MSELLGADVSLGPCMLEGHGSCQFIVRPRAAAAIVEDRAPAAVEQAAD
jgi:hypothetical protein